MILDSERSDEVIDFTMMCAFLCMCVCLCPRKEVEKIFRFSNLVVIFGRKLDLVGAFERLIQKIPRNFQQEYLLLTSGKKGKLKNTGIFRQNQFMTK